MTTKEQEEPFLNRWSRLKQEARNDASAPTPSATVPPSPAESKEPPDLPPVEKLTFDSDYRAFFHPKVNEETRRAALKKLFGDPRFNVMDGLDVYIDDYSKSDPIPPAMLVGLRQAQKILEWAKGEDKAAPQGRAEPEGAAGSQPVALDPPASAAEASPGGEQAVDKIPAAPGRVAGNRSSGNA